MITIKTYFMQMQNEQLTFLQDKIQQIGSAIFFNLSDSVSKLPTSIVNTVKVDDYGYVWFFVKKPNSQLKEFETEFPVRLDYFKKGSDCFLQVTGKGWSVTDPEELSAFFELATESTPTDLKDMVLVKVKMLKADYYETQTRTNVSWWQNAVDTFITWFRNPPHMGPGTYFPAS